MTHVAIATETGRIQKSAFSAALIGVLAATAATFLFYHLASPYWMDEVFTGALACQNDVAAVAELAANDVHPPTYALLVHEAFLFFGCNLLVARAMSIAFSLTGVALLLMSLDANAAGRARLALIVAAMPPFWYYTVEARSYALMFCVACGVIFLSSQKDARYKQYAVYLALIGATVNFFGLYLIPVALLLGLSTDRSFCRNKRFQFAAALLAAAVAALYARTLPNALSATSHGFWIPKPSFDGLFGRLAAFIFGHRLAVDLILATIALSAYLTRKNLDAHEIATLLRYLAAFSIFVLVIFGLSYIKPMYVDRYTYFLTPFVALFIWRLSRAGADCPDAAGANRAHLLTCFTFSLLCLFDCAAAPAIAPYIRALNWEKAAREADCTARSPCYFALDNTVEPAFSDAQYASVANFWAEDKASYRAVRPMELNEVLLRPELKKLLYVGSRDPRLNFPAIAAAHRLSCVSYMVRDNGAEFCTLPQ